MKKFLSILIAFMFISSVSCSKQTDFDMSSKAEIRTELLSFKEANVAMGEAFSRIISLDKANNKIIIFGEGKSGEYLVYVTDKDFKDHATIELTAKDGEEFKSACIDRLGRVTVLSVLNGDTMLYIYGSLGNLSAEENLGDVVPESEFSALIYNTADGYVINHGNENIAVIDKEMKYIGTVETGGKEILGCCKDANGMPIVILSGEECGIAVIDGCTLADSVNCGSLSSSAYALCSGNSEYSAVGNFADGIYGFDGEKWTKITDYMDNTFSPDDVWNMLSLSDNEYVVVNGNSLILLSERDISEIKMRKTVTVASLYEGGCCKDLIKKFNAENDEYKIETVLYEYDKINGLKMDIVTGNAPDIITDYIPGLDPAMYYYDLTEYLKNDPGLNADDFIPGFLDGISFKGKIPVIFPVFSMNTLVGKTKFVGGNENVSYDEFIEIYENLPDDISIVNSQEEFRMEDNFRVFVDINEFMDYSNGECNFDSPEFIKMLKFVKDNKIGLTQQEWEIMLDGNTGFSHDDDPLGFREDRLLFCDYFNNPVSVVETVHAFFDESVTFSGYPSGDGIGGSINAPYHYSIMLNAKEPDGAWEFIKFAFREDNIEKSYFSSLDAVFRSQMEKTKNVTHWENNEEHPGGRYNYFCDPNTGEWSYIDYDSFTQDEADHLEAYVRKCVKKYNWYDKGVDAIIDEELGEYFNSDRSAEKTAEIIQNRMSIYMSENYS